MKKLPLRGNDKQQKGQVEKERKHVLDRCKGVSLSETEKWTVHPCLLTRVGRSPLILLITANGK